MKYFIITFIYVISLIYLLHSQVIIPNEAFLINDDTTGITVEHAHFSVATSNDGKTIVVWFDNRRASHDIYMQMFSNSGSPIGSIIKVNTDTNRVKHSFPNVAVDHRGFFGIVWNDERNGAEDVYFQMFDSTGNFIGQNIQLNEIPGRDRYVLSIDCDSSGNYVVAWEDRQIGTSTIYYQRIDPDGNLVGPNITVREDSRSRGRPAVSVLDSHELAIIWQERNGDDYDLFLEKYSADDAPIGSAVMVNDSSDARQEYADLTYSKNGYLFAVWVDSRDTTTYSDNIYCQIFDELGNKIGKYICVNDSI
jgi:hypothetical protein